MTNILWVSWVCIVSVQAPTELSQLSSLGLQETRVHSLYYFVIYLIPGHHSQCLGWQIKQFPNPQVCPVLFMLYLDFSMSQQYCGTSFLDTYEFGLESNISNIKGKRNYRSWVWVVIPYLRSVLVARLLV